MTALRIFTIYHDPKDYPGQYVTRGWTVRPGGVVEPDPIPVAVVCTLDVARRAVPPQCDFRIDRAAEDDPKIVESWL
jgi:hypothetical protein